MHIKKIKIHNFKGFRDFEMDFNAGVNIIVGNNEAGKSTIIEAIHLALTGILNGRYLKNELSQHLFNNEAINEYISALSSEDATAKQAELPYISIELFLHGEGLAALMGDGNSELKDECGVSYKICFNEKYQPEYEAFVKSKSVRTLPIEYYDVVWESCARESITSRSIPLKSALIDSSSNRHQNGADIYISRIIKDILEDTEIINVSQAHRSMKEVFMDDESVKAINTKLKAAVDISNKDIALSVDMSSKNAWETTLTTYLDYVPFHYVGKGEQAIVKTKIALAHKRAEVANVLLLEEPENHLSHTKLSYLISTITKSCENKQVIISTHSSFVANKLGLENLLLLDNKKHFPFCSLPKDTYDFLKKLAGYDTLRLLLCKKAILVEGDSDELICQKAYIDKHDCLPIENEVDVISVGMSFLRFLEIAKVIQKPTCVVTDNDGDIENNITKKYSEYLGDNAQTKDYIKICYDGTVNPAENLPNFNYNTLEPNLVKSIGLQALNTLFGKSYTTTDELNKYMSANKTECALQIFNSTEKYTFPQYILNAID